MHILFLTDNFPPESNAPASRTFEHAVHWVQSGHKVSVITCAPNFPEGVLYEGYENSWIRRENLKGIKVIRVKSYITANEGFLRRTLDYMSFGFMAFVVGLFEKRPDVLVTTSPQFFCACGGWLLAFFRRIPWVFELRDIWPASIVAVGAMKEGVLIHLLEKLELFLYERSDRIICVAPSFKSDLIERGIDRNKIDVVLNGVELKGFQPASSKDPHMSDEYGLKGKFVVGYVGTHGMAHALESILDAATLLKGDEEIVFMFAGGGAASSQLEASVRRLGLSNVVLVPRQPKEKMAAVWSLCDVSLISLRDTPLFGKVIPSKIFESMAMGLPMIVSCPRGEATGLVEKANAGLIVEPEDPQALVSAIRTLFENRSVFQELAEASALAASQYDRSRFANDMLSCFRAAL